MTIKLSDDRKQLTPATVIVLATIGFLLLSACASDDPYRRTKQGAAIGAAAGAAAWLAGVAAGALLAKAVANMAGSANKASFMALVDSSNAAARAAVGSSSLGIVSA